MSSVPTISWELQGRGETHSVLLQSPLCGDGFLTRRWALEGLGIACKSLFDVIDDLESGRLMRVLPEFSGKSYPIHAVFPSRIQTARVRALYDAILAHFEPRAERCAAWLASS
ncbi:MAG: LysR substrate-binding domain-containing protein [Myxococcota bacterium]